MAKRYSMKYLQKYISEPVEYLFEMNFYRVMCFERTEVL